MKVLKIANLRALISNVSTELDSVHSQINDKLSGEEIDSDSLKSLIQLQMKLQNKLSELNSTLATAFQKEIDQLISNKSQCEALCAVEKKQLEKELTQFIQYVNIDISSKSPSSNEMGNMFEKITASVRENCPLLFDVLNTILLHSKDERKVSEKRVMSAVHALAILVSLKSQKIANDFKLIFTLLCISFGAGNRFVGMLNHVGLTVSWQKAMKYFDSQRKRLEDTILSITPANIPLILLMDNINMYRGKTRHLRLFKSVGSTMWNFTVRAVLVPNLEGLEHILSDKEACLSSQLPPTKMEPQELFWRIIQKRQNCSLLLLTDTYRSC